MNPQVPSPITTIYKEQRASQGRKKDYCSCIFLLYSVLINSFMMKVQAQPMPKKMPWAQGTPMCRFCSPTWCILPALMAAWWVLDGYKDLSHHIELWGHHNWNVSIQDPPHKASRLATQGNLWPAEERSVSFLCTSNMNYTCIYFWRKFHKHSSLRNLPSLPNTPYPYSTEASH